MAHCLTQNVTACNGYHATDGVGLVFCLASDTGQKCPEVCDEECNTCGEPLESKQRLTKTCERHPLRVAVIFMAMGHLWLHFGVDDHPFATFDVHQTGL